MANTSGPDSVRIVGVGARDDLTELQEFVAKYKVGDIDHIADEDAQIWRELGVTSQPAWAFVNDDGTVEVQIGALGEEALLAKMEMLAAT